MGKFKKVITNEYFILAVITLLALFIRLLRIDKPYGLWYDEMLTYVFSSKSFPMGIIQTLLKEDFHMPLYYMFVHGWMKLFGTSDVMLRCSSVFWGVLSVPGFFYLGKEYKSKTLGYFLAFVACLSPIMILYSQELRFYSMLIFFSIVSLISFLKLIEKSQKKYVLLFAFSNLVILYISTTGIVFVGMEFLLLFVHYFLYKKEKFKSLVYFGIIFFICTIPYLLLLLSYMKAADNAFLDPFVWSKSRWYTAVFLLNDWFSPFIAGQYGQNPTIFDDYIKLQGGMLVLSLMCSTTVCFVIGFISGLRKINQKILYLLLIAFAFLGVEIFLCIQDSFILMTKYTLIIFPILLLIATDGLLLLKPEILKKICISVIAVLFVYNSLNYKIMPSFRMRLGGYNFVAKELNKLNIAPNDYILYPNRTTLLRKYVPNGKLINFDIAEVLYLDKTKQESLKVFDRNFVLTTNTSNSLDRLGTYLLSSKPTKELKQFSDEAVAQIPKGNKLIFVDDWHEPASDRIIKSFVIDYRNGKVSKDLYKELMFYFTYAKIYNDLKELINSNPKLKRISYKKPSELKRWNICIYEKI